MPPGIRPGWVRTLDGLFVHPETKNVMRSISGMSLLWWWSREGWTVYELACFVSPLVVDVVLPVTLQRQALAVLFVLTVEVPQIQFFDVVGFRFLGICVHIDKSLMCQCVKAGSTAFSVSTSTVEEFHGFLRAARAIRTWTLDITSTNLCTWQALARVFSRQSTVASGRMSLSICVTVAPVFSL